MLAGPLKAFLINVISQLECSLSTSGIPVLQRVGKEGLADQTRAQEAGGQFLTDKFVSALKGERKCPPSILTQNLLYPLRCPFCFPYRQTIELDIT